MKIYEKVHAYIKKKGLKPSDVAKEAGFFAKTFDVILSGKQKLYPEELRAICYALKVKPEKFM